MTLGAVVAVALWLSLVEQTTTDDLLPQTQDGQPASAAAPTWIPSISRTSLLPHPFAGVCMNCHVILGGRPAQVDASTAGALGLSPDELALVAAGQVVRPPSIVSDLKAPLIGRSSDLPHSYWGACSNCHSVVHAGAGPSPELLSRGLERGQQRLVRMKLSDRQIAHANPDSGSDLWRYLSYAFGVVALIMLGLSAVYPIIKVLARRGPKSSRKRFNMKKWFRIHEWSSIGFSSAAVMHWLLSARGNAILHLSLVFAIVLTASGLAYRWHTLKGHKKSVRWIHSQRFLTYAMIGTALAGHFVVSSLWIN